MPQPRKPQKMSTRAKIVQLGLVAAGATCASVGAALIYLPAGLLLAGAVAGAFGLLIDLDGDR